MADIRDTNSLAEALWGEPFPGWLKFVDIWEQVHGERFYRLEWLETPKAAPAEEVSDLYFIGSSSGPIKIGVSDDPAQRLKALQTSNPYKLTILAVVSGGAMMEPEYHRRFAAHRLEGEWFEPHPDIVAEIERCKPRPFSAQSEQRLSDGLQTVFGACSSGESR